MQLKLFTVDAFSDQPFTGNPAAVIPLDKSLPESTLQRIAFEMNLSETAYLTPPDTPSPWTESSRFGLRWFTPAKEVALCGHATLASAHVLFNLLGNKSTSIEFQTLSGILVARKQNDEIILDFPLNPPKSLSDTQKEKYLPIAKHISGNKLKEMVFSPTTGKLLVRMDDSCSRDDLESVKPNMEVLLKGSDGSEVKGVIVTLQGDLHTLQGDLHRSKNTSRGLDDFNFVSRYFAPWVGIPEDPVTGSAHTVLGPYWSGELGLKELKCRQCSPRGGNLALSIRDDGRVDIRGRGTTVIEGHINI